MREVKSIAQDSYREEMLAQHCGLISISGRMYDDATDKFKHRYELKSSTKSNSAVSTARDVTIEKIDNDWKQKYWIVATGNEFKKGTQKRFEWNQIWLSHPRFLDDEFERIKKPLLIRKKLIQHLRSIIEDDRLLNTHKKELDIIFKRGATLNDPKLKLSAFKQGGISIDIHNSSIAKQQVEEYVTKYPLNTYVNVPDQVLFNDFFG